MQRVIKRDGEKLSLISLRLSRQFLMLIKKLLNQSRLVRKINQLATIVEEKCKEYKSN